MPCSDLVLLFPLLAAWGSSLRSPSAAVGQLMVVWGEHRCARSKRLQLELCGSGNFASLIPVALRYRSLCTRRSPGLFARGFFAIAWECLSDLVLEVFWVFALDLGGYAEG